MALDIIKLYISLISQFFKLSDVTVMSLPGPHQSPPPLLPENAHSLCTAHYLLKILSDVQETVTELNGMDISSDTGLKSLLESVKWRFEDILIHTWLRGKFILQVRFSFLLLIFP
jgi:exocyst complex component 2